MMVHYNILPSAQTVNKEYYLRQAIRLKRPELLANDSRFFHHGNAPCHPALALRDYFAKNSTYIVSQPTYSLDFAPCDFCLLAPNRKG